MSDKLIGAVSLKVKPDTKNFRDEAERDLKKQMRGMDDKVTIKGKVDYDTEPAKQKLRDLQRESRESIKLKVDVDGLSSQRWGDYARDAKKHLRDIANEQKKLDADAEMGMAKNWAKRKGELKKQAAEYKDLLGSILDQSKVSKDLDKGLNFSGIQGALDKLAASQQRLSTISANSWDDTAKAVDRYNGALARLSAHEQADDGSLAWTSQGVKLLEAVETMERQVAALKEQDSTLADLQRRWDSLGKAQKNAIADVMTSENNADIERAKQDIEDFRSSLQSMSTMQVANLRKARLEAEKMAAVEAEIEARRRRLRAQRTFVGWENNTTATPENQNIQVDDAYLRTEKVREYARELEKLTAVELKRLEKVSKAGEAWGREMTAAEIGFLEQVTDADERHQLIRTEANRRRMQANFNGSQFDTNRQLSDMARVERENRAHLARMQEASDNYYRTIGRARQKSYEDMFGIDFDVNLKRDLDRLAKMYEDALKPGKGRAEWEKIKLKLDDDSINKVKHRYEELKREIEDIEADVIANPTGFMAVAAQLKWLTRPRSVNIFAKVHGRSLDIARDSLQSLAGINVAKNVGKGFENAFRNLDEYILKMGKLGTILGSVGSGLLGLAGAIGSVGIGLVQSTGLLAMVPTLAYAGAASFGVFKIAFADFANAFSDIPVVAEQALASLPPMARKAVEELRGTWTSIRVPVQEAFWGQMGDSIGQLKKRIIPQIREGLLTLAPEAAKATKGVLDSFLKIADNGDLRRMLDNTGKMMAEAAKGAEPLFDAINRLGLRGSEYLPRFGKWMADGAKGFDQWIKKADEAGKIDQWIENGVQSVRDFSSAIGGAGKILGGFAKAAADAGGPSLGDLARGLNSVGDAMNGEPFKSRMATLFDGAFRGVGNLTVGVKALGTSVGESADFWAEMLDVTTKVAAVNMTNFARILSNDYAQSGMLLAFEGMLNLAEDLTPAFDNVAHIVGDVGRIAHTSFGSLAPIINTIVSSIAGVVSNLSDGAIAAIPGLTRQINSGLSTLGEILRVVSGGLGGVLEGFGALPGPIQQVVTGLGAFLLMRGSLGRMMTAFGNTGPINKMRDSLVLAAGANTKMVESISRMGPAAVVMSTASGHVSSFSNQIRTSGQRMDALKGVGKGLFGLLGGPWGVALGAATVATTIWANSQADARARVEELQGTLDQTTGAITGATEAMVNQRLATEDVSGWEKWNGQSKTAAETAEAFGITQQDLARIVAEGGSAYDDLYSKVSAGDGIMRDATKHSFEQQDALAAWGDEVGVASDKIGGAKNIRNLKKFMEENRGAIDEGTAAILAFNAKVTDMSDQTGISEGAAKRLQSAFETLGSETASVDQKVQAFKATLDSLKDGQLSAQEAARQLERSWESALSGLDGIDKTKVKFKSFFDESTGQFTRFDGEAGKIYDSAKTIMDGVTTAGQAAYQAAIDSGSTAEVASQKAAAAMKLNGGHVKEFAKLTGLSVSEARAILESFTSADWEVTAMFGADAELFNTEREKALAAGEEFTQEKWEAILAANGVDAEAAIARAELAGATFAESEYSTVLKGTDAEFQAAVDAAHERGIDFSASFYEAYLTGNPNDALAAAGVAKAAGIAFSSAFYQAHLDGNAAAFIGVVNGAGKKGKAFAEDIYMAYLKANPDPATRSTEAAKKFAKAFASGDYTAAIEASNKDALSKISAAAKKGKNFSEDDYNALLKSLDKTSPGTSAALRTIRKMTNGDYKAAIAALNKAHAGASSAKRTVDGVKQGKKASIEARDATGAGRAAARQSINNTSGRASIFGRWAGWNPPALTIWAKVKGLFSGGNGLNGGIDAPGTKLGLAAGLPDTRLLKAFADGGIESHTAQFSSPASNTFRIWGEPETGGEAYIPLAASKRTRSVAIWKEAGKRMGVYADGGIEGSSTAAQRPGNTFHITNNYPVAEKTSVTINRALQYAGAPDFNE